MVFIRYFNRLFGAYYFLFLKLRKFNKTKIEDWQAMLFVSFNQFLLLLLMFVFIRKKMDVEVQPHYKPFVILILLLLLFLNGRYFLSKKERKNLLIDEFSSLDKGQKIVWKCAAILFPLLMIVIIAINSTM